MRNELHTAGKYQIPLIRKQIIDFDTISLLSYVQTKGNDEENAYKIVHFFTQDWLFDMQLLSIPFASNNSLNCFIVCTRVQATYLLFFPDLYLQIRH